MIDTNGLIFRQRPPLYWMLKKPILGFFNNGSSEVNSEEPHKLLDFQFSQFGNPSMDCLLSGRFQQPEKLSSRTVQPGRMARVHGRDGGGRAPRCLEPHEYGERVERHPRDVRCPYPSPAHLSPEVQDDRGLGDPEAGLVRAGQELYIEGVPVAEHLRECLLEGGAGEYLEPCLRIAQRQPEERLQYGRVYPAHHLPRERVLEARVRVVL